MSKEFHNPLVSRGQCRVSDSWFEATCLNTRHRVMTPVLKTLSSEKCMQSADHEWYSRHNINTDLLLSLGPRQLSHRPQTSVWFVSSQNGPLALEAPALALAPVKNRVESL